MSSPRAEKLQGLMSEWGIHTQQSVDGTVLNAIEGALSRSAMLQLRAAQLVVAGGDGERVRTRGAMDEVCRAIPELVQYRWQPFLVRAMLIAGWPEDCGGIAELVIAPWEAPWGREERHTDAVTMWRASLIERRSAGDSGSRFSRGEARRDGPSIAEPTLVPVPSALRLADPRVDSALQHLSNTSSGWAYHSYADQLCVLLEAMVLDVRDAGGLPSAVLVAEQNYRWLSEHRGEGLPWSGFSTQIIALLRALEEALAPAASVRLNAGYLAHLESVRQRDWNYDGNWATHFYQLLGTFRAGLRDAIPWAHVNSALSKQAVEVSDFRSRVDAGVQRAITDARPPELDLLWWGQARYSRTRSLPYRKLPTPAQVWIAAAEAAELSVRLSPAPAAAFLVRILEELCHQVGEKRTVLEWMSGGYEILRDDRRLLSVPLATVSDADAAGLPISRLFRLAASGDRPTADHLRELFVDPDRLIDLGDWITWIFHELLLSRRLT